MYFKCLVYNCCVISTNPPPPFSFSLILLMPLHRSFILGLFFLVDKEHRGDRKVMLCLFWWKSKPGRFIPEKMHQYTKANLKRHDNELAYTTNDLTPRPPLLPYHW